MVSAYILAHSAVPLFAMRPYVSREYTYVCGRQVRLPHSRNQLNRTAAIKCIHCPEARKLVQLVVLQRGAKTGEVLKVTN